MAYLFIYLFIYFLSLFFYFLRPHLWHTEVPRLGIESEPQLPAYITATVTQDPSCACNLHRNRRILNPLSEAKDQTCLLMDISQVRNPLSHNGNSQNNYLKTRFLGVPLVAQWKRI